MKFINKFLHFVGHTHIHTNKNYLFRTSIHQAFSIGTCQFWSKNDEIWVIRARANGVYKFSEVFQTNKFLTTTIEWTTEVPGWNTEKMSLKNKQKTLLRFLIFWLTLNVIWIVSYMIFGIATFVPFQICCHEVILLILCLYIWILICLVYWKKELAETQFNWIYHFALSLFYHFCPYWSKVWSIILSQVRKHTNWCL